MKRRRGCTRGEGGREEETGLSLPPFLHAPIHVELLYRNDSIGSQRRKTGRRISVNGGNNGGRMG